MVKLNMANMNTLFRKGYLLAVVIMAANIFIVNEMKASDIENGDTNKKEELLEIEEREKIIKGLRKKPEETNENKVGKKKKGGIGLKSFLGFLLSHENIITLFGGAVSSVANNYLKWWDYNPGGYLNLRIGCLGWRSKKLFDIVQVDINLNVGRGISWVILSSYNFIKFFTVDNGKKEGYVKPLHFSFLVTNLISANVLTTLIGFFLFQGFVSIPLTFHLSKFNFSISISLDSIIWMGIGYILELKVKKKEEKKR